MSNEEKSLKSVGMLSNQEMMQKIANNDQTLTDVKMLTSSKITDQLKVFLVAQARNELMRVIKLTQFLDRVENNFMSTVDDAMMEGSLTLKQYSDIIGVTTSLLARSNDLIMKAIKDDSLTTILNTTVYTSDSTSATTSISCLKDAQSRERTRVVIQQILDRTSQYGNTMTQEETIIES